MLPKRYIAFIVICLLTFIQTLYYFILEIKGGTHEIFLNATFFLQVNFSILDQTAYHALPNCSSLLSANSSNTSSNHKVSVQKILYTYQELEARHSATIHPGGHWFPTTCQVEQRLAIIVCYRKRREHLKMFLNNIHPFLQQQQLDYTVIVVNQHEPEQFNRAALFNIGFIEALKLYPFNCFIFHDVDLLPEDSRNIYKCVNQPQHMSAAMDKFDYKMPYSTFFGGVTAFSTDDFIGANGYPNVYWGWGGEDDDMYLRVVKKLKKSIKRYPMEIARYKMIRSYHKSAPVNPYRRKILHSKYQYSLDGINKTQYKLHRVTFYKLFTLVNVTLIEETYQQIRTRLNIKENITKRRGIFEFFPLFKKE